MLLLRGGLFVAACQSPRINSLLNCVPIHEFLRAKGGGHRLGGGYNYAAQLRKTRRGREEPCGGRPRPLAISVLLLRALRSTGGITPYPGLPLPNNKNTRLASADAGRRRCSNLLEQTFCHLLVLLLVVLGHHLNTRTYLSKRSSPRRPRCPVNRPPASLFAHLTRPRCHAETTADGYRTETIGTRSRNCHAYKSLQYDWQLRVRPGTPCAHPHVYYSYHRWCN